MPIAASTYWNEVHGFTPADVEDDAEGLQTMRNLGKNMAFMLKSFELGKKALGGVPEQERSSFTSFHTE